MKIYGSLDVQGSVNKIGSISIDETDVGPDKIIAYNLTRDIYEFVGLDNLNIPSERIYYDSLIVGKTYPLTIEYFNRVNRKFAPELIANWNTYTQCKIQIIDNDNVYENLTFSTINDMITFINTLPNSGTEFNNNIIVRVYDVIDFSIPTIDKMYGLNKLYSGLVGGGKSRNGKVNNCAGMRSDWPQGVYMLREMFIDQNQFLSFLDYETFKSHDGLYGCWVSRNSLKKFNLPKPNGVIVISGNTGRRVANNNYESFQIVSTTEEFTLENPRVFTYVENGRGSMPPLYVIKDPLLPAGRSAINYSVLSSNNNSSVVFFRCKGEGTEDVNYSIFIKPLGIDLLVINYINIQDYKIECVLTNKMRQKNTFKIIDEASIPLNMADESRDVLTIPKTSWIFGPFYKKNVSGDCYSKSGLNAWEISIRLRNKSTGRVSQFSKSRIIAENTTYGFRFMIV